jgi:YegS/Rv2252/BmrU family lipid kinase
VAAAVGDARALVIINPISGTGGRSDLVGPRVALAAAVAKTHHLDANILVTEAPGHAREMTREALAQGVRFFVAWGGDGTINEVGSALVHQQAALAVIPSGSGNGLARELRIPFAPRAAFDVALSGVERVIDCGELDGHYFFNMAGLGLDARVAHEFAAHGLERRGFRRYIEITVRELFRFEADEHTVVADGTTLRTRALFVVLANGRQYGNGAAIAPAALVDDGYLDVVVVEDRAVWKTLLAMPLVFAGQAARVPGVTMMRAREVELTAARPALLHVDGEPHVGGAHLMARVHPSALRVRVPAGPLRGTRPTIGA